ncbi:MAG: hypothetical protein MJ000_09660 [Bacteroidales bacterium]|nr:hypothetical protein [Bacteroidales bacterium]
MTREKIIKSIAKSFANGVVVANSGNALDSRILRIFIERTYIKAFEDGILYRKFNILPDDFHTLETDDEFYTKYHEETNF